MKLDKEIERLKKALNIISDMELASSLGLKQSDYSNRKNRGTLLPLILPYALKNRISLDWLFSGEGSSKINELVMDPSFNLIVIGDIIELVESELAAIRTVMKPRNKRRLIMELYDMCCKVISSSKLVPDKYMKDNEDALRNVIRISARVSR